jgi:serine phosphatase RsbU (regulator of sigma subunit)
VQLPNGSILISIGDVAGHGVGASITAASIRQSMIGYALTGADPAEILKHANRVTRFQYPETFATAIVGIIDRSCEVLSYASAGHPAPFLAETRDAPARPLDAGGIPLGIADTMETVLHRLPITRDAVLVLYTDGLTEFARDIERAEKTMRSLVRIVPSTTSRSFWRSSEPLIPGCCRSIPRASLRNGASTPAMRKRRERHVTS